MCILYEYLINIAVDSPETLIISSSGEASEAVPNCLGRSLFLLFLRLFLRLAFFSFFVEFTTFKNMIASNDHCVSRCCDCDFFAGFQRYLDYSSTDGLFGSNCSGRTSSTTPQRGTGWWAGTTPKALAASTPKICSSKQFLGQAGPPSISG